MSWPCRPFAQRNTAHVDRTPTIFFPKFTFGVTAAALYIGWFVSRVGLQEPADLICDLETAVSQP